MLDELSVDNLGLIGAARIEPGPGLVVITGETGAGKTLLLGALRLLRGEQARKDQIGPGGDAATVEGRFIVDGVEHVVSRKIHGSRSRAYVDGAMVTVSAVADAYGDLIDIVGQHDRNALADPASVRALVDGAFDAAGRRAWTAYQEAWASLRGIDERRALLGGDRRALERELEVVRFQTAEISGAGFDSGDDGLLDQTATRLRNAEALGERLAAASTAVGEEGASGSLEEAVRQISIAAKTDPSLEQLAQLAGEAAGLVGELSAEIAGVSADFERDPQHLDEVEQRLAVLGDLRRKYGDDLDAVLAFGEDSAQRAAHLESVLDDAGALETARAQAADALDGAATELRRVRKKAANRLAKSARAHLGELGFTDPVVGIRINPSEPGPNGADRLVLEFASDATLEARPASRIASSGELSRLTLALRLAAGVEDATVVAFDEIDAGTGGATALAMGRKLAALSAGRQVFCVTHLPQVAAFADRHFAVRRQGTVATVELVEDEERVEELSRMLAGLPESDRGREHAAELLDLASDRVT